MKFLKLYNFWKMESRNLPDNLFFSRVTQAQHLTLCVWCVVCVWWCPLDGCDAPMGQRGKTTVHTQSLCTVNVYTQPWAQHSNEQD